MRKEKIKEIRALLWEAAKLQAEAENKLGKVWRIVNEDLKK